jgi:hypothetical protein
MGWSEAFFPFDKVVDSSCGPHYASGSFPILADSGYHESDSVEDAV